jgi:1-aminocyclopropane-1-carboxylate deaminase/D-cysteine desulfhydrase-like pyridoxal-dependent ACC family enzyme
MHLHFESITEEPVPFLEKDNVSVSLLRLDKIHPVISGNKWFKLQHYLKEAKEQRREKIVTFGGAWSNHIVATAAACKMNNIPSAGIIRGEEPAQLSETLKQAKTYGMQLYFISRDEYSEKKVPAALVHENYYLINEGGYGKKGADGAVDILRYCGKDPIANAFTHCCAAVGTGTMLAGLINAASPQQQVVGISVLKNNHALEQSVAALLNKEPKRWQIIHDYHFGGYAKYSPALIEFMNKLYYEAKIPSDFVYTAKLFYAIADLINGNHFPTGSRILLIHSGGLQGNHSLGKGTLIY